MPELPEVETIRRGLARRILGRRIRSVEVLRAKVVRNSPEEFVRRLAGNAFVQIERRGKLLIFHLERGERFMLVHLKMTGQLIYQQSGGSLVAGGHPWPPIANGLPNAYSRVVFSFQDGSKLFFNDLRVFGFMHVVDEPELAEVLAVYGVEPLSRAFTWETFRQILGGRNSMLKAVLLNQHMIAGLGNIYADEVAWRARVRPQRRVATMTVAEQQRVFRAISQVLREAIAYGGTTFNNFRDADGKRGTYVHKLKVYGRAGQVCRRPECRRAGAVLKRIVVAQRGTVYCPRCQR